MKPFHSPGKTTVRAFSGYSREQDAKWQALSDIAYAAGYGYSQTRMATPGVTLPAEVVDERLHQVAEAWRYEASTRDRQSSGLDPAQELPLGAQYYLAERLIPLPQTDRPWEGPPVRAAYPGPIIRWPGSGDA